MVAKLVEWLEILMADESAVAWADGTVVGVVINY
jgi:hypothetical protein